MRIGLLHYRIDLSVEVYLKNMVEQLASLGVRIHFFTPQDNAPNSVDLLWDPRLAGGTPPWRSLRQDKIPVVASLFDVAPLGIAPWEYYDSLPTCMRGLYGVAKRAYAWQRVWRDKCACIITLSEFSKQEIQSKLGLRAMNIVPIPLGVDTDRFRPATTTEPAETLEAEPDGDYLLHVAQYQPKKNLRRILDAYSGLRQEARPRLVAVLSRHPEMEMPKGVTLISGPIPEEELAALYRGALAFIFPSLHEGFGLPILEAMASGTPVITSNTTACPETAGDAAILVNPRSVRAITSAIQQLIDDPKARERLIKDGRARARALSWELSAKRHLEVFEWVADGGSGAIPSFEEERSTAA